MPNNRVKEWDSFGMDRYMSYRRLYSAADIDRIIAAAGELPDGQVEV